MSLSLLPFLPINSDFAVPPIEGYCNSFYGTWERSQACTRAIWKLPGGRQHPKEPESVEFTIDQDLVRITCQCKSSLVRAPCFQTTRTELGRVIPLLTLRNPGDCTIQIEMAGPHLPATVTLAPHAIIRMAERVQGGCARRTSFVRGWIAADMSELKDWVVAEETNLDAPYREMPSIHPYLSRDMNHH